MIQFILNNKDISTNLPPGMVLLDFVRYHQHLTGTKVGCNEGDCGACTLLVGELVNNELQYRSLTSCLTPLGNVHGKHVVTIEGLNMDGLNPIQQAMYDESATQCGFCTPGFVVSLAGFCLSDKTATTQNAIAAIDGNICRCTGYKSIERAAGKVAQVMQARQSAEPTVFVSENHILPAWFAGIKQRLHLLQTELNGQLQPTSATEWVGGGTDVYVQKHDTLKDASIKFLFDDARLKGITQQGNRCIIGASATVTNLSESPVMQQYFPHLANYIKLVSSTPIRNIATVGGNLINASPIGDLTIFLLALDATLIFSNGGESRTLPLRQLYKGYKTLDKQPDEQLESISFELPGDNTVFNFEKVSKRTNLDIASVNSAICLTMQGNSIEDVRIAAGGIAPVPKLLDKTNTFLKGQPLSDATIDQAIAIAQTDISPISDARGTADYKRLLLGQLIKAHFLTVTANALR
ncbi:2Fe-2S iron-sulfur cluster binding domain-containing protein [Niastella caeni]|uniref:2Fe-2S iron-sulfur cluster binding domain-containing protein n=1 Tax=Niastella caeni TaxID=2569763 RepID=A0A4S8HXV3_9BACT|nr:FAD binding domain-containing protein [Niastella caeni]THU40608.1 2Fe-2S iron-sulfur cluster binding domain-containing protein [Niastella caeni]